MAFPFVKQHDSMQCGVACLCMVCRHYGCFASLGQLEEVCSPTAEGVSLKGIADGARAMGLDSAGLRIAPEQLGELPLPCILHWNQNHFVVLFKISRNGKYFHVADPGKGIVRYSRDEFLRHWLPEGGADSPKGIALALEPDDGFRKVDPPKGSTRRAFRLIAGYMLEYRRYFIQIVLGLLLGSLLQLVFPFLTQAIVDVGISNRDIGFIWLILLGELFIVVGSTATDFIRRWLLLHISMRVNVSMLSDFFIKLMKLPMSFFDTKLMGDLMQRMSDHNRIQTFLTQQTLGVLFSVISFVVFGVVLWIYDALIFAIFMAGSLLYAGWIALFLRRRKVLDYEVFEQQANNNNKTYQLITSMQEIKLQNCETRRRHEWEDVQADLFLLQMKSLRLQQSQEAGSVFINEIKNILITVLAATAVIKGDLTLGGMLAVQYVIGQLNSPVEQLMGFIGMLQDVKISLDRISEITTAREEDAATSDAKPLAETPATPEGACGAEEGICFEGVSFRYDRHAMRLTIDDVSMHLPRGKVTAIVGASGSGKTTLLKLMLGYYPVEQGRLTVEGREISGMSLTEWRKRCGCVMQEGVIFSESILRNIAVSDGPVDTERVRYAARLACIDDFITALPLGYATKIGKDGTGLSNGQKQRILIARAIYRNPEFIFLDEATNSLDARNEREIVENLREFYMGRTVVIIAHRLSTVRDADNIIVIDGGKVVEQGTHADLVEARGKYYSLVQNQLELGS